MLITFACLVREHHFGWSVSRDCVRGHVGVNSAKKKRLVDAGKVTISLQLIFFFLFVDHPTGSKEESER